MATSLGSVIFDFPLKWTNKAKPVVAGNERRTRSGNIIQTVPHILSQNHRHARFQFTWVPIDDVETLLNMWKTGASYTLTDPEGVTASYTVWFRRDDGIEDDPENVAFGEDADKALIDGYETDLYNGYMNLIIDES